MSTEAQLRSRDRRRRSTPFRTRAPCHVRHAGPRQRSAWNQACNASPSAAACRRSSLPASLGRGRVLCVWAAEHRHAALLGNPTIAEIAWRAGWWPHGRSEHHRLGRTLAARHGSAPQGRQRPQCFQRDPDQVDGLARMDPARTITPSVGRRMVHFGDQESQAKDKKEISQDKSSGNEGVAARPINGRWHVIAGKT